MKSNLHSHTQFCDGRASMQEMLEAAREAGFSTWGFSPHAPISVDSPCNMKKSQVDDYLSEVRRLRNLFPDIRVLAGMEVDFIDDDNGPASPEVKDYGLDYVIGSVHFIPDRKGVWHDIDGSPERFKKTLHEFFDDDIDYVVRTFWKQTQKMIKGGGFDIIGHIDKVALNASFIRSDIEEDPEYRQLAMETIDMAIEKGYRIEINTKHWGKYGRFFPHPRFWKHILSSGIEMPVNSDAHYTETVADGMSEAFSLLSSIKNNNNQ